MTNARSGRWPARRSFRSDPPTSLRPRSSRLRGRAERGASVWPLARDTPLRLRSAHSSASPPFRSRAANGQTEAIGDDERGKVTRRRGSHGERVERMTRSRPEFNFRIFGKDGPVEGDVLTTASTSSPIRINWTDRGFFRAKRDDTRRPVHAASFEEGQVRL